MTTQAAADIRERIRRLGSLPYDEVVEIALYGPGGFFTSGSGAGRRADFITSPELGPLFGAVIANFLDQEWERLGRPDSFLVVEAGAGRGALAKSVLDASPRCSSSLRYVCVERSAFLREQIVSTLMVEPAMNVVSEVPADEEDGGARSSFTSVVGSKGPVLSVLDELPALSFVGVVLANELLDNLPFRLIERTETTHHESGSEVNWAEVRVGLDDDELKLKEVLVEAPGDMDAEGQRLAPDAPVGARLALQGQARAWVQQALGLLQRGRLVVIDYGDNSQSMANRPWREWLRTYRGHERGGHPLDDLGLQDITCEVALDQLDRVRIPSSITRQAEWLKLHGIDALADEARQLWQERAAKGDLLAMAARSRVGEAQALTDPEGLGSFWVLDWVVD